MAKKIFPARSSPGYKQKIERLSKDCFVERNLLWVNLNRQGGLIRSVLFCPDSLKKIVLEAAHCSPMSGHSGKQRTIDRVELGYWWPGLTYDVANFLLACHRCREIAGAKPASSPLQPLPALSEPGLRVHMDLFGPLRTRSASGQKYIMVMTDAFSKYTELAAIPDKTAVSVARAFFEHWICRHGVPQLIVSDRGKEFLNSTMKHLCELMGLDHQATSAYHPQSNAQAETYNKTMVRYLNSMLENEQTLDWEELLPAMMMAYNCHVQRATQESPFFLTYLHSPRLPFFNLEKPQPLYGESYVDDAFRGLQYSFRHAKDSMDLAREARKSYFDRKAKERVFSVGDKVLVHFPKVPRGVNPKFYKKWRGSYKVVKKIGNLNLLVRASLHSKPILVHVDCVRALSPADKLVKLSGKGGESFPPLPAPAAFSSKGNECVEHNSPSDDFSAYIESASESEDEETPVEAGPQPAGGQVTRAGAARAGISVPEISLPSRCWASSAHRRK